MSLVAGKRWYAVQTRSNFETSACTELEMRGVESYHASFREIHQWADRRKTVNRPLFPGYVFARFQDSHDAGRLQHADPRLVRVLKPGEDISGKKRPVDGLLRQFRT